MAAVCGTSATKEPIVSEGWDDAELPVDVELDEDDDDLDDDGWDDDLGDDLEDGE